MSAGFESGGEEPPAELVPSAPDTAARRLRAAHARAAHARAAHARAGPTGPDPAGPGRSAATWTAAGSARTGEPDGGPPPARCGTAPAPPHPRPVGDAHPSVPYRSRHPPPFPERRPYPSTHRPWPGSRRYRPRLRRRTLPGRRPPSRRGPGRPPRPCAWSWASACSRGAGAGVWLDHGPAAPTPTAAEVSRRDFAAARGLAQRARRHALPAAPCTARAAARAAPTAPGRGSASHPTAAARTPSTRCWRRRCAPAGCVRLLRATYTDVTSSAVTTVGLLFTKADAAAMRGAARALRGHRTPRQPHRSDAPSRTPRRGTVAAGFGDRQRASWTVVLAADRPSSSTRSAASPTAATSTSPSPPPTPSPRAPPAPPAQAGLATTPQALADAVGGRARGAARALTADRKDIRDEAATGRRAVAAVALGPAASRSSRPTRDAVRDQEWALDALHAQRGVADHEGRGRHRRRARHRRRRHATPTCPGRSCEGKDMVGFGAKPRRPRLGQARHRAWPGSSPVTATAPVAPTECWASRRRPGSCPYG